MAIVDYAAFGGCQDRAEVLITLRSQDEKTTSFRFQQTAIVGQLLVAAKLHVPLFESISITRIFIVDPDTNQVIGDTAPLVDYQRKILLAVVKPTSELSFSGEYPRYLYKPTLQQILTAFDFFLQACSVCGSSWYPNRLSFYHTLDKVL